MNDQTPTIKEQHARMDAHYAFQAEAMTAAERIDKSCDSIIETAAQAEARIDQLIEHFMAPESHGTIDDGTHGPGEANGNQTK